MQIITFAGIRERKKFNSSFYNKVDIINTCSFVHAFYILIENLQITADPEYIFHPN